jgi:hypothetical protein
VVLIRVSLYISSMVRQSGDDQLVVDIEAALHSALLTLFVSTAVGFTQAPMVTVRA